MINTEIKEILSNSKHPFFDVVYAVLLAQEKKVTQRIAEGKPEFICPNCIAKCKIYKIAVPAKYRKVMYYGCRICGEGKDLFDGTVAIILDNSGTTNEPEDGQIWRVNWFTEQRIFDFDWVEIIKATDEKIERFAVQIGNDTDPIRKGKYQKMNCKVSSSCKLSDNSMKVLRSIFGEIKIV